MQTGSRGRACLTCMNLAKAEGRPGTGRGACVGYGSCGVHGAARSALPPCRRKVPRTVVAGGAVSTIRVRSDWIGGRTLRTRASLLVWVPAICLCGFDTTRVARRLASRMRIATMQARKTCPAWAGCEGQCSEDEEAVETSRAALGEQFGRKGQLLASRGSNSRLLEPIPATPRNLAATRLENWRKRTLGCFLASSLIP